jgi:hypothetical protein
MTLRRAAVAHINWGGIQSLHFHSGGGTIHYYARISYSDFEEFRESSRETALALLTQLQVKSFVSASSFFFFFSFQRKWTILIARLTRGTFVKCLLIMHADKCRSARCNCIMHFWENDTKLDFLSDSFEGDLDSSEESSFVRERFFVIYIY